MPPDGNVGLAAAIAIRERHPTVGVLVLSQYLEPDYALKLLGAGVDRVPPEGSPRERQGAARRDVNRRVLAVLLYLDGSA